MIYVDILSCWIRYVIYIYIVFLLCGPWSFYWFTDVNVSTYNTQPCRLILSAIRVGYVCVCTGVFAGVNISTYNTQPCSGILSTKRVGYQTGIPSSVIYCNIPQYQDLWLGNVPHRLL